MRRKQRLISRTAAPILLLGILAILGCWLVERGGVFTQNTAAVDALAGIRISEVQTNNVLTMKDDQGDSPGWIEIENTGDQPTSLYGLCLTRDSKINKRFVFPKTTLAPGEHLLILCDGKAGRGLRAPFRLPKSGNTTLYLYDGVSRLLDSVTVPALKADESLVRGIDGEWNVSAIPSPGSPNRASGETREASGDVIIQEIVSANAVAFPDESGVCDDYIELRNCTAQVVSLEGWQLTDNAARPDKWTFPAVNLPAGGLLAIHCSGSDRRATLRTCTLVSGSPRARQ